MLYDPRQDNKEAKAESLSSLISWLELQPPEEEYCFTDNGHCLLAQYLTSCGYRKVRCGGHAWREGVYGQYKEFPHEFLQIAINIPWTFGAALERALAI